ncbi:hypothetical protein RND81_06G083000 [Saponaria officinalis]|uniref:GRF-type domain-containing protein n=1 Tax=Saponaria officinalis TaxID=3572 RepID=A0AAW1K988_SAPOF
MSNVSYESTSKSVVECRCGIPAALKTLMTEANTGRRFLTCNFYNRETGMCGYNYFKWVDEPMNETSWLKSEIGVQRRSLERLENKCDHIGACSFVASKSSISISHSIFCLQQKGSNHAF